MLGVVHVNRRWQEKSGIEMLGEESALPSIDNSRQKEKNLGRTFSERGDEYTKKKKELSLPGKM